MKQFHVLILEDDLEVLSVILGKLYQLNERIVATKEGRLLVTVYSTFEDVEELVNHQDKHKYDVILLDRDCGLGGSFHALNIEKFGGDKIIAMSMVPPYNDEAQDRGVNHRHDKNFSDLDSFADQLLESLELILLK